MGTGCHLSPGPQSRCRHRQDSVQVCGRSWARAEAEPAEGPRVAPALRPAHPRACRVTSPTPWAPASLICARWSPCLFLRSPGPRRGEPAQPPPPPWAALPQVRGAFPLSLRVFAPGPLSQETRPGDRTSHTSHRDLQLLTLLRCTVAAVAHAVMHAPPSFRSDVTAQGHVVCLFWSCCTPGVWMVLGML